MQETHFLSDTDRCNKNDLFNVFIIKIIHIIKIIESMSSSDKEKWKKIIPDEIIVKMQQLSSWSSDSIIELCKTVFSKRK